MILESFGSMVLGARQGTASSHPHVHSGDEVDSSAAADQFEAPPLPLELIGMVASRVPNQTLVALMGTCKAVRQLPSKDNLIERLKPGINSYLPAPDHSRASIMKTLVQQAHLESNEEISCTTAFKTAKTLRANVRHIFPDGRHLLIGSGGEASQLKIVDAHAIGAGASYKPVLKFPPSAFLDDFFERHFIIRQPGNIELWELNEARFRKVATLPRNKVALDDITRVTPDPRKIAYHPSGAWERLQVWDLAPKPPCLITFPDGKSEFLYVDFSPRGRFIVTHTPEAVSVWRNGSLLPGRATLMKFAPDANVSFSADERCAAVYWRCKKRIEFWSMLDQSPHQSVWNAEDPIHSLRLSPHGKFMIVDALSGKVGIREISTSRMTLPPRGEESRSRVGYRFSADESFVCGPSEKGFCLIDLAVVPPKRYELPVNVFVRLQFSQDNSLVVFFDYNHRASIWNLRARPPIGFMPVEFLGQMWEQKDVHFSPYGTFVALNEMYSSTLAFELYPLPLSILTAVGELGEEELEYERERLKFQYKIVCASLDDDGES